MDPVAAVVWSVAFVLVTVTVTGLARRVGWSSPVLLVLVGAIASFVPGIPEVEVEPELVLFGVLPPLLFAEAVRTSFIDVRNRREPILLLSVGTVAFTVVVVGFTTSALLPAIGLAAAFAFAAVVAPTDAVAVAAVAGRAPLPRRVVTILEGESLLNDATALVALNGAILAMTATVTPVLIVGDFVLAVVGGLVVGLAVGYVMATVRGRLESVVIDTSLALVTPYLAFIAAEAIMGSGVLAVVVAGLYLGYRSPVVQSSAARIAESVNWRTIQFLLENAIFLFIGLSFSTILSGAMDSGPGVWGAIWLGAAILAALVVARFVFVLASAALLRRGPRRFRDANVTWRNAVAVASASVRGVVTLAAVFLLPPETPDREFLQLLAFIVIVGSLLGGLALPTLVRILRLSPPNLEQERMERRTLLAEARSAGLQRLDAEMSEDDEDRVIEQLRSNAALVADSIEHGTSDLDTESLLAAYGRLRRAMLAAEREAVLSARDEGRFPEPAVKAVLRAIDAEELSLLAGSDGAGGTGPARGGGGQPEPGPLDIGPEPEDGQGTRAGPPL